MELTPLEIDRLEKLDKLVHSIYLRLKRFEKLGEKFYNSETKAVLENLIKEANLTELDRQLADAARIRCKSNFEIKVDNFFNKLEDLIKEFKNK